MDKTKRIVLGYSGGKDSTALLLWMKKNGYEFETIFADTGWEHPETYKYVQYINETLLDNRLITVKPKLDFVELIRKKRIFPSRKIRFCTQFLKIIPMKNFLNLPNTDIIWVTGERSEESPSRAKKPVYEYDNVMGCYMWRPIKDITWQDVFALHNEFAIEPNPLYMRGFRRVGYLQTKPIIGRWLQTITENYK
jgi:3'-phosphoadenosine 5'-phosphosulfate sulfotransferase (PAPS reductase)/FAD synthetase